MEFENETDNLIDKLLDIAVTDNYCKIYMLARFITQSTEKRKQIFNLRADFEKRFSTLNYCEGVIKSGSLIIDIKGIRWSRDEIKKECDLLVEKINFIVFKDLNNPRNDGGVV